MEPALDEDLPPYGLNNEEEVQQPNIHISDVIAAIQTADPTFEAAIHNYGGSDMLNAGAPMPGPSNPIQQNQSTACHSRSRVNPFVRIVEQPAPKSLRFRYECEGRSAGSIPGAHSTPENKTYPTIEIANYKGRAVVVVSCVTKDQPHKPHPHNLVGRDGCKRGVCTVEINSDSMQVSFSNLGIQCVKKKDIDEALRVREEIRVDPFRTGFAHRSQHTSIDLNAVRLCFQVFLEGPDRGSFKKPLIPVVSDIIFDKKAMSDLLICKMSHCSAPVAGGREIILLCEKVAKEDIQIRFYEEIDGQVVWEGLGDFQHANVHKQVAISFRSPRYRSLEVEQPVKVWIQLRRPSDGTTSEPCAFEMLPLDSDPQVLKRKRQKFEADPNYHILRQLQAPLHDVASFDPLAHQRTYNSNMFDIPPELGIKLEPREQPSSPYGGQNLAHCGNYRIPQHTPSPQPHPQATPSPPAEYGIPQAQWGMMNVPPTNHNLLPAPNQFNLLDMDNQQLENLNQQLDIIEPFLDTGGRMNVEQENMTDSFTRLTTNAYNNLTGG